MSLKKLCAVHIGFSLPASDPEACSSGSASSCCSPLASPVDHSACKYQPRRSLLSEELLARATCGEESETTESEEESSYTDEGDSDDDEGATPEELAALAQEQQQQGLFFNAPSTLQRTRSAPLKIPISE